MSSAGRGVAIASGLVRVTVTSGSRRVDLVLPGAVPLAELTPELARSVGLLDPTTAHGGYRAVTSEGRSLASDIGLTAQGVQDGAVLTVSAGVDDPAPRVYDDVVEAMTDVVEHDLVPWRAATGRRTALVAAGLFLVLGAWALLVQRDAPLSGAAAALVALGLVVGAVVLSRGQDEPEAAVGVGWLAAGYAAAAGVMLAPDGSAPLAEPLATAGAGALLVGLIGVVALGAGRLLLLPPVVVGAVALGAGLLFRSTDVRPATVLTIVLVVVVIAGSAFPWLALGATPTRVDQLASVEDITTDPEDIDRAQVSADARIAHEILLAISGAVGLLLVLVAPLLVGLGVAGTLLAIDACVVVMLRTRQYRSGSEVLTGLVAGILGLVSTAITVLLVWPEWRPALSVLLAAGGAIVLAATLLPSTPSVRRGRFGDLLETIALLGLLPLLVLAIGLFGTVQDRVG